jgi:hypothetical protein
VHPARISMSLSTLYTCSNTEAASGYLFMTAWDSDFSDASFCLQYFRNVCTGMSTILVYTQVPHVMLSHASLHATMDGWQTSPMSPSPNRSWPCTHNIK